MTEQELDRIMRRVLIDSLKADDLPSAENLLYPFHATSKYRRQIRAMLANPKRWARQRERPVWQRGLQKAAVIFLTCTLALGGVTAFSPTAKATLVRWVTEWYDNTIVYLYTGEQSAEPLAQYEISELPDGYTETVRNVSPALIAVTYENQNGDVIYFDYNFVQEGGLTSIELNEDDVFDVQVNGMDGYFIKSRIPGNLHSLTWIDPDLNIHFDLGGIFELEEFLHMAESISLCKTPK